MSLLKNLRAGLAVALNTREHFKACEKCRQLDIFTMDPDAPLWNGCDEGKRILKAAQVNATAAMGQLQHLPRPSRKNPKAP